MAKQQYNNNARRQNNYFTQALQRNNNNFDQFIDNARIDQLQNDSVRIFRDLARNRIDVMQCEQYLSNDKLIQILEQEAWKTLIHNTEVFNSIDYRIHGMEYNQQQIDPYLISLRDEWRCRQEVYNIIYYNIQNFKVTKDINFILALSSQIGRNGRYV